MNPLEQRALLLRQLAALRQQGLPHHRALALAADGLPVGELRALARRALQLLESGGPAPDDAPSLERLLGRGDCEPLELEHAALRVEAQLWSQTATRTAGVYLSVAVAGPLLLTALVAWLPVFWPALPMTHGLPVPFLVLLAAMRWAGVPLAVAALVALRRFEPQLAPGHQRAQLAASLLAEPADGAFDGLPLGEVERRYLQARQAQVGAPAAARELAAELVDESRRSLSIFQHLAPLLGVFLLLPVLAMILSLLLLPLLLPVGSIGGI